jgi:hypothetical protein
VELYPTLEVVPGNHKTQAFLAHSAVPITFTEDDFEQVASGNYVVKVIYLPDPSFQDLATTGADELVSSRLEPGVDPVAEACRRGSILAIVRLGNIQLELTNSPAMDAPSPYHMKPGPPPPPPGMMPGGPGLMPPVNGLMPPGMGPMMPGVPGPMVPGGPGPMMPPVNGMPMPPANGMPMMPPAGMAPALPPGARPVPGPGGFSSGGTPSAGAGAPLAALPSGPGLPGSRLPDVPSVQPTKYQGPSSVGSTLGDAGRVPTPAELAGQKSPAAEPAPAGAPKPW